MREEQVRCVVNIYENCIESHYTRKDADDGSIGMKRIAVVTIKQLGSKITSEVDQDNV